MIKRAVPRADVAGEIVDPIVASVRPWRIVLFGSRARGTADAESDCDLFIEVDAEEAALKEIESDIRQLLVGSGLHLDLKVRRRGEIERRRDDPGTIEWDVAREGVVLYADPAASRVLMPSAHVREPSRDPPESMHEWLRAAERDLRHAERLRGVDEDFSPEICWLSHQTCEKHLKALLVARRVRPARTHDLGELLAALRADGCDLAGLDADCALLTQHGVVARYPAGLDLSEADAEVASTAAERIVAAVRAHLPPRLH